MDGWTSYIDQFLGWVSRHLPLFWRLMIGAREDFHWQSPAYLTCRPIYGAYRERHFTQRGANISNESLIVIKPRFSFFWLKYGVEIVGICYSSHEELRQFESLGIFLVSKNPVKLDYSYSATMNGIQVFNEGHIAFGTLDNGKYLEANGHFILPYFRRSSRIARNARINFHWERISEHEIKGKTGQGSLHGIADIRRFLKNGGEL